MTKEAREFLDGLTKQQRPILVGFLDDEVTTQKEHEASVINSQGLDDQVEYLESTGWQDMVDSLRAALEDGEDIE